MIKPTLLTYFRPGSAAPRRRISYYAADLPAETEERQHSAVLAELAGTPWNVHRVSPLWNVAWRDTGAPGAELLDTRAEDGEEAGRNIMRLLGELCIVITQFLLTNHSRTDQHMEREYDEKGLKRCARIIQGYVATHAVSAQDNPYTVSMEVVKGLKGTRTDTDALRITVSTSMFEEVKVIFVGVLCGIEAAELQLKSGDVANLPVLLTAGNLDTRERVIYGLEQCYDCHISPLFLPDEELRWMAAMWAGLRPHEAAGADSDREDSQEEPHKSSKQISKKSKKPIKKMTKKPKTTNKPQEFKMSFKIPNKDDTVKEKIRHITCVFPMEQVRTVSVLSLFYLYDTHCSTIKFCFQVWNHVQSNSDTNVMDDKEMAEFHDILGSFLQSGTSIDLAALELVQISLPFLKVSRAGVLRIQEEDQVKMVLRYLTELCQGSMLQADPTLSSSVQDNVTMDWTKTN